MPIDLIVVGGGPAGAAAATTARRAGLRVTIIERDAVPRVRPGEAAHPGIEPLLARLGAIDAVLDADFLRHQGQWVKWGAQPQRFQSFGTDPDGPWRGFQLWRPTFDGLMLERACEQGVELIRPCREVLPIVENGRVMGVVTPERTLRARFVIDATGRARWLARHLRLPVERVSPKLFAWFAYATGSCAIRDTAPALTSDSEGWTWTACVRPGLYQWVRVTNDGTRPEAQWRPEEFSGLVPLHSPRAADVTASCVRPSAGLGFSLVGDAAFVLDPLSGHGLLRALMSGMKAGHSAAAVTRHDAVEFDLIDEYSEWVAHWFRADYAQLRSLYAQLGPAWSMDVGDGAARAPFENSEGRLARSQPVFAGARGEAHC